MTTETDLAPELPPLITASWIRVNAHALTEPQRNGDSCVYCGEGRSFPRSLVPVGYLGARQLFACLPACRPSQGPDRP